MPGIWLHDDQRLQEAKALLATYQKERAVTSRAAYEQLKEAGQHKTVVDKIIEHPFDQHYLPWSHSGQVLLR